MKPSAFASLLALSVFAGGGVGAIAGAATVGPNPFPDETETKAKIAAVTRGEAMPDAGLIASAFAGPGTVRAAHDSARRERAAMGGATGALLGLGAAGMIGLYSLAYRRSSPRILKG